MMNDFEGGVKIRPAGVEDLDFLVESDLRGDGYTNTEEVEELLPENRREHRAKIAGFVAGGEDMAWIAETSAGELVGMILARYRDFGHEADIEANRFLLRFLPREIFPEDGRFCEVFNLWVHPDYRRRGLATRLKQGIEAEAVRRGMSMMYTHTESANPHVVELNLKLGYQVVRIGPIWDAVERVSLVKWLK